MTARSPTMVTLHGTRFVECRWWNDGSIGDRLGKQTCLPLHHASRSFVVFNTAEVDGFGKENEL